MLRFIAHNHLLHNMRSFSILLLTHFKVAVGNGLGQIEGRYRWYYFLLAEKQARDDAINQLQTLSALLAGKPCPAAQARLPQGGTKLIILNIEGRRLWPRPLRQIGASGRWRL